MSLRAVCAVLVLACSLACLAVTEQELDVRFERARADAEAGDYAKALEGYVAIFEESRGVEAYTGVRLSFVPSEIAQMGADYPPALDALRGLRDAARRNAEAANAGFDAMQELAALNNYLREPEETLSFAAGLRDPFNDHAATRHDLLDLVLFDLAMREKHEAGVIEDVRRAGQFLADEIRLVEKAGDDAAYARTRIGENASRAYVIMKQFNMDQDAAVLKKGVLTLQPERAATYAALIQQARFAGLTDLKNALLAEAKKALPSSDHERLEEAAREE